MGVRTYAGMVALLGLFLIGYGMVNQWVEVWGIGLVLLIGGFLVAGAWVPEGYEVVYDYGKCDWCNKELPRDYHYCNMCSEKFCSKRCLYEHKKEEHNQ